MPKNKTPHIKDRETALDFQGNRVRGAEKQGYTRQAATNKRPKELQTRAFALEACALQSSLLL